jgi:hypothetical protein
VKTGQHVAFVIKKEESGPYWPRLLKQSGKFSWLKTDFNKWKDEDEEEEVVAPGAESPFGGDMASMMGGMGGGMGGMDINQLMQMQGMMGGAGGPGGFDMGDEEEDEEAVPST